MPGKRLKASAHRSPGRRSGPQAAPELFHALVEHSSDAVALLDETGAITYVSQAATRLLGYRVPELTRTNALARRRGDLAQSGLRGDDGVPARGMGRPAVRGLRPPR